MSDKRGEISGLGRDIQSLCADLHLQISDTFDDIRAQLAAAELLLNNQIDATCARLSVDRHTQSWPQIMPVLSASSKAALELLSQETPGKTRLELRKRILENRFPKYPKEVEALLTDDVLDQIILFTQALDAKPRLGSIPLVLIAYLYVHRGEGNVALKAMEEFTGHITPQSYGVSSRVLQSFTRLQNAIVKRLKSGHVVPWIVRGN